MWENRSRRLGRVLHETQQQRPCEPRGAGSRKSSTQPTSIVGYPDSNVLPVDLIISNIHGLLPVDPGRRIIRDAAIAVSGGKIVAVDKSAEIAKRYSAKQTVDGRRTVATPGFID